MKVNEKRVLKDENGNDVEAVVKTEKSLKEVGKETLEKHPKLTKWGKRVGRSCAVAAAFVCGMLVAKSCETNHRGGSQINELPPVSEPETQIEGPIDDEPAVVSVEETQ